MAHHLHHHLALDVGNDSTETMSHLATSHTQGPSCIYMSIDHSQILGSCCRSRETYLSLQAIVLSLSRYFAQTLRYANPSQFQLCKLTGSAHSLSLSCYTTNNPSSTTPTFSQRRLLSTTNPSTPELKTHTHNSSKSPPSPSTPYTLKMCTAQLTTCRQCKTRWFRITNPCAEGKNFSNCDSFSDGKPRSDRDLMTRMVDKEECPVCTPEKYDGDNLRLVKSMSTGVRYGVGPGRDQARGEFGFVCCSVM